LASFILTEPREVLVQLGHDPLNPGMIVRAGGFPKLPKVVARVVEGDGIDGKPDRVGYGPEGPRKRKAVRGDTACRRCRGDRQDKRRRHGSDTSGSSGSNGSPGGLEEV
jgi:hypothetical protein